jgi:hypothetical protein
MSDIIEKYDAELKEHVTVDSLNLKDRTRQLPAYKHIWVGRLIRHKIELNKLKDTKYEKLEELKQRIRAEHLTTLSAPAAEKYANNTAVMKEINKKIVDQELIIEYLEKVEKIMHSYGFDLKNMIEIEKLETM